MANITDPKPLPPITSTKQTTETVPTFYTDYLQNIAKGGANAVTQGGVAGASPLQTQAYNLAPQIAFAGSETLGDASDILKNAATTRAPDVVQDYMNPYLKSVVDQSQNIGLENIRQSIPLLQAMGVRTGQDLSKNAFNAITQGVGRQSTDLTGALTKLLSSGYDTSIKAAQDDLSRGVVGGNALTNTGRAQQDIAAGGLKTLSTLGGTQRDIQQDIFDKPLKQVKDYASLFAGVPIPKGTASEEVGIGRKDQYGLSDLSKILSGSSLGRMIYDELVSRTGGQSPSRPGTPSTPGTPGSNPTSPPENMPGDYPAGIDWDNLPGDYPAVPDEGYTDTDNDELIRIILGLGGDD